MLDHYSGNRSTAVYGVRLLPLPLCRTESREARDKVFGRYVYSGIVKMATPPSFPERANVERGTIVLQIHPDGFTSYQYKEAESTDQASWALKQRYARDEVNPHFFENLSTGTPSLGEFRVEIDIEAPRETVFKYVGDIQTHAIYADFVENVEILSDKQYGEGVVFTQTHTDSDDRFESEIIEFDENEKLGWVVRKDLANLYINYEFETHENGTKVVHTGISSSYDSVEHLEQTYSNNEKEMNNLKSILESDPQDYRP